MLDKDKHFIQELEKAEPFLDEMIEKVGTQIDKLIANLEKNPDQDSVMVGMQLVIEWRQELLAVLVSSKSKSITLFRFYKELNETQPVLQRDISSTSQASLN